MATEILMPALSPTMEEGTLAKWLVKEGDTVKSGDIMAEIETDKATMEFEAVDEGVVAKILVAEGTDNVKVGTVIMQLEGEGAEAPAGVVPLTAEQIRAAGIAPRAARFAGVRPEALVAFCLGLSGALAGMAGLFEAAGPGGQITDSFGSGYGFTAIIVAFLGRLHPRDRLTVHDLD